MNEIYAALLSCLLGAVPAGGGVVEIPGPDDTRCFCYPQVIVPAVYHPKPEETKTVRV